MNGKVADEFKKLQEEQYTLEISKSKHQEEIFKISLRQQEINTRLNTMTLEAMRNLKAPGVLVPDMKGSFNPDKN